MLAHTKSLFFVATVSDSDEYSTFTVRITNKDDSNSIDEDGDGIPDNQRELRFTAYLTTRDYAMDVRLEEGGLDGRTGELILAPGDEETVGMWIRNMGNGDDTAHSRIDWIERCCHTHCLLEGLANRCEQ